MSKQEHNMSPAEHYQEAEKILEFSNTELYNYTLGQRQLLVARAQVHATLAISPQSHEYGAYFINPLAKGDGRGYYRREEAPEEEKGPRES